MKRVSFVFILGAGALAIADTSPFVFYESKEMLSFVGERAEVADPQKQGIFAFRNRADLDRSLDLEILRARRDDGLRPYVKVRTPAEDIFEAMIRGNADRMTKSAASSGLDLTEPLQVNVAFSEVKTGFLSKKRIFRANPVNPLGLALESGSTAVLEAVLKNFEERYPDKGELLKALSVSPARLKARMTELDARIKRLNEAEEFERENGRVDGPPRGDYIRQLETDLENLQRTSKVYLEFRKKKGETEVLLPRNAGLGVAPRSATHR